MINFLLADFYEAVPGLEHQIDTASSEAANSLVSEGRSALVYLVLNWADQATRKLDLVPPVNWIFRTRFHLEQRQLTNAQLVTELKALLQLLEDEAGREYFFHYPKAKAEMLMRVPADWGTVLAAFPSSEYDITQGVDCYACGHDTAAAFHFMRLCERGLRALAIERRVWTSKKPIERADWTKLLQDLDKKVLAEAPEIKDAKRQEYLEFYQGALGNLEHLKHWWRHPLSHARVRCDEPQARSILENVRAMMTRVASKTDEDGRRISWR
jgi:hypothetical protein